MIGPPDLPELRDFIRGRRAALAGFMEQGAALELDGNVLRIILRNDIYGRYLSDNRALIAELASECYRRAIEAVVCRPDGAAAGNGSNPAIGAHQAGEAAKVPIAGAQEKSTPTPDLGLKPLSYAIAYARHGIKVFPIYEIERDRQCSCGKLECLSGGKHPRLKDWQTLATTDEDQIKRWWLEWKHANIGVKCGRDSNLTVLDVDGEEGRETLRALEMEKGELPETPVAITGSGGAHYYFAFEDGMQNAVRFAPGLDIRTEGGLVVGVGSKTKQKYEWETAFALGKELLPAPMPAWLANMVRAAADKSKSNGGFHVDEEIPAGQRNETLFKLGRSLKAKGLGEAAIQAALREENIAKCRPPLARDEVDQIGHRCFAAPDRPNFESNSEQKREAPFGLVTLNVEQLLRCQTEPREFIIEPILRQKDLAMIFSWRGVGKTLLALEMAHSIATGGRCLRWDAPRPRRVLYIDGELPLQVIQERVARLVAANEKEPPSVDFLQFITPDVQERPIPNLADPKAQLMIDQIIADQKIEVLFIDSISTLCSSGRENEAESWLPIQEWALRLRRRGVTVIFVHHAGKGGAQRGTSRREDILDTVIHLIHPADYRPEEGSRFEVHFEKTRALWGESLRPFEAKLEIVNGAAIWTMSDVEELNHNRAKELFDEGMSTRDVAEALGISKSASARLKTRLKKEAKV